MSMKSLSFDRKGEGGKNIAYCQCVLCIIFQLFGQLNSANCSVALGQTVLQYNCVDSGCAFLTGVLQYEVWMLN